MQIACQSKDRFLVCKDLHGNRSWNTQMCVAISYDISFIFLVYYYLTPLSYLFSLVSPWFFGEYLFFFSYMEYGDSSYSFRNVYIFTSGGSIQSQAGLFFATQRCSVNIDMCKHVTGVYSCINTVFTPLRLSACLPVFLPPIHFSLFMVSP